MPNSCFNVSEFISYAKYTSAMWQTMTPEIIFRAQIDAANRVKQLFYSFWVHLPWRIHISGRTVPLKMIVRAQIDASNHIK